MNFKKVFWIWIFLIGFAMILLIISVVVIDPINAVGFPIVRGINNNKYAQDQYMDVFKPYELARRKAEVIFTGTSRVYRGMKPTLYGFTDDKVYNLGFSSLSLDHMQEYLRFAYRINQPQKLFIGLDLFNFSKNNYKNRTDGFSKERLENINRLFNWYYGVKESLQLDKRLLTITLQKSYDDKDATLLFHNGWYVKDKEVLDIVEEGYYYNLNSYIRTYKSFEYIPESLDCLQSIVKEAEDRGIEVYVFFNPINADIRNIIYLCGHGKQLNEIKTELTYRIGKVYDFNFNNSYTENRKFYYDCSHYSPRMGEYIKKDILGGKSTDKMHILTPNNVKTYLADDRIGYEKWVNTHKKYVDKISAKIMNNSKIQKGELKDVLGF